MAIGHSHMEHSDQLEIIIQYKMILELGIVNLEDNLLLEELMK